MQNIDQIKSQAHYHTCIICGRKHYCESLACAKENYICEMHDGEKIILTSSTFAKQKCIGHECARCKKIWKHNYVCNKPANLEAMCSDCTAQNAVEINRTELVKEIEKNSHDTLSGRERAERFLEQEASLNLEIRDSQGKLLENWLEITTEHFTALRILQEKVKIDLQVNSKVTAKARIEKCSKLTPEEQEQYKRDALKTKRKPHEISLENKQKAYDKVISNAVKSIMQANPKMTHEQATKRAVKIIGTFEVKYNG